MTIKTPFLTEVGFCVFIKVKNIDPMLQILNPGTMAPIKRLVSRENTYPSQNKIRFLQKQNSDRSQPLFHRLRPVFQKVMICTFNRSANRHPSGSRLMKKLIHSPWSISGPQKNIGTLSCPKGCHKISGSLRPTIAGS